MGLPAGKRLGLSLARKMVCDAMHFSTRVPLVSIERKLNLQPVIVARQLAEPRPGWFSIFTKTFALVAQRIPELRRSYLSLPWPRMYEHAVSVVAVPIERSLTGERAVLATQIREPEHKSLLDLESHLRHAKNAPLHEVSDFRRQLRLVKLPGFLRRFAWWVGLNASGRWRQRYFGTFGITGVSSLGVQSLHFLSPLSSTITFGVIEPDGTAIFRMMFDHRVFDGVVGALALAEVQKVLENEIVAELQQLALSPQASAA